MLDEFVYMICFCSDIEFFLTQARDLQPEVVYTNQQVLFVNKDVQCTAPNLQFPCSDWWMVFEVGLFSQFFNQVLMLGKTSVSDLSEHVFDLILELYNIDSHLLLSVLPQLEFKLKVRQKDGVALVCLKSRLAHGDSYDITRPAS